MSPHFLCVDNYISFLTTVRVFHRRTLTFMRGAANLLPLNAKCSSTPGINQAGPETLATRELCQIRDLCRPARQKRIASNKLDEPPARTRQKCGEVTGDHARHLAVECRVERTETSCEQLVVVTCDEMSRSH